MMMEMLLVWFARVRAAGDGCCVGLVALYFLNFHVVAPMMFPWFTETRNWVSVLSHVVLGMAIAAVYVGSGDRRA